MLGKEKEELRQMKVASSEEGESHTSLSSQTRCALENQMATLPHMDIISRKEPTSLFRMERLDLSIIWLKDGEEF